VRNPLSLGRTADQRPGCPHEPQCTQGPPAPTDRD
jgi:hypothetical protein